MDQFHLRSVNHRKSWPLFGAIFITSLLLGSHFNCVCVASVNELLPEKDGESPVSIGRKFELGFFTPEGSTDGGRYVGIWYYSHFTHLPRTIVWIANRDTPIPKNASPGVLALDNGNLKVLDGQGTEYFSTGLESSLDVYRTVKLQDSGNLVLIDGQSGVYSWQSFLHPTDTFLPGMLMDDSFKLTSWFSPNVPKAGNYTFQKDQDDNKQFSVRKRSILHWKSDQSGGPEMPIFVVAFLSNFSVSLADEYKASKADKRTSLANTRLLMNSSGEIQFYSWDDRYGWSLLWSEPHDPCSVYNPCGNFGIWSNRNGRLPCECLPGFEPNSPDNWNSGDFSSGCARKSSICNKNTKPDTFLNLKLMKVGSKYTSLEFENEENCREECLANCQCQAYSFVGLNGRGGTNNAQANCSIWTTDLSNLQNEYQYADGIHNLSISIHVAASDIESTSRDCESCGQNILPYPLSRGPNCGDPSYRRFNCDNSTGKLQFLTLNGSYEVISINKDEHKFVIQPHGAENASNCGDKDPAGRVVMFNQSLQFNVTNWCYNDGLNLAKGERKIEISWLPPLEPLCNSSDNCKQDWSYSVCNASADGVRRCLCIPDYHWDGLTLNCTQAVKRQSEQSTKLIVLITVIAAVLLVGSISCFSFRRRILVKRKEREENILGNLDDSERRDQNLVVEDDKVVDVPFFSLESILAATDNFSDANKLGQGGFGPVYKGVFPGGKEIAVKRLSSYSGQGIVELKNEVVLIAKLQHRNLVRLLGYCIKGSEKLLLYEYMPNKSLDSFIFDQGRCTLLDWKKRFDIIRGIARGLLYLDQDSKLRVIHRDLKASNIPLDVELNPKISDYGLARIVGGKETEANTQKVVGTYGYMSPDYALEGLFSTKSDIFSFGVILLEIISGKRNIGFYGPVLSL